VHEIRDIPNQHRSYCEPHRHSCAELNLLISFDQLVFRVTLGGEVYVLTSPASILVPPNLPHSANVVEGTGFFVAILGVNDYASSLLNGGLAPSGQ
jgi:hypothetical protein